MTSTLHRLLDQRGLLSRRDTLVLGAGAVATVVAPAIVAAPATAQEETERHGLSTTLVARNNLPASNAAELVAYAKQNPGKMNYGSSGVGSLPHLGGKMMERAAGIEMVHVPFGGDAPAMKLSVSFAV